MFVEVRFRTRKKWWSFWTQSFSSTMISLFKKLKRAELPHCSVLLVGSLQQVMATSGGHLAGGSGSDDPNKAGGKRGFKPEVIAILRSAFVKDQHLDKRRREELSAGTGLNLNQITDWFRNERRKDKGTTVVAHPTAVAHEGAGDAPEPSIPTLSLVPFTSEGVHQSPNLLQIALPHRSYFEADIITTTELGPEIDLPRFLDIPEDNNAFRYSQHYHAMDHSQITNSAVQEVMILTANLERDVWKKVNGRQILDPTTYQKMFKPYKNVMGWKNCSKANAQVQMGDQELVRMLMNADSWCEFFPTIVSTAKTLKVLAPAKTSENPDGSLQLMYQEVQGMSPLVPCSKVIFIRTCKRISEGNWIVADVSFDPPQIAADISSYRRHPSGCSIRSIDEGSSEVTWVEHVEIQENTQMNLLYNDLLQSGLTYGANRWLACLQ